MKKNPTLCAAIGFAVLFLFCGCAVKPGLIGEKYRHDALGHPCRGDMVLEYAGFTLAYSESCRQALWVSYVLNGENLNNPVTGRYDTFMADRRVREPVQPGDYRKSGFDRGHLAPAADMAYSFEAMRDSFYMTNISPQYPACNRRVWLSVENMVRQWALQEDFLYVITGPYFTGRCDRMKPGGVIVPGGFFKAVLDLTAPYKMIAVTVSNDADGGQITFMSVNELETLTGYDFFDRLDDVLEAELENSADLRSWEN